MKMNQIIRQKRIEKGLTQEQVALCLGVTAPAVNKWERGVSYPDITLLPPLARLLDTDLNTLMSFQDDLTAAEVALFLNHLADLAQHGGVDPAFDAAQEKLRQFPSSGILLLNTALLLDGLLSMDPKGESHPRQQEVLALYERAAASSDERISAQANAMLANRAIQQHDHETARRLLAQIPDPPEFDKKQIQINLQLDAGALDEAARLSEEKLLSATNEIHTILMTLMEIAAKQNRLEDAEQIAEAEEELFSAAGVSSLLFNNDKASANALLLSIKADQAITYGIVKSIEDMVNRFIQSQSYGKNFKVNFLDVSPYNRKEVGDMYLKAAQYGLPTVSMYAASQGLGQAELDSMNFLENEVLEIKKLFVPLQSSSTQSGTASTESGGATDEGGAPPKDANDLTESGLQNREDA